MDFIEVFASSKWELIKDLSADKYSPLQLAAKYNTTVGNVGHQLRLLEAFGLLKKEKIQNREKGKPRTLFSLSNNYAYLVTASKNIQERKLLKLSDYHDTILRMWFLEDINLHYPLEKFFWKLEDHIDNIEAIAVKIVNPNRIEVLVVTNKKELLDKKIKQKIGIKNTDGSTVLFYNKLVTKAEFCKIVKTGFL